MLILWHRESREKVKVITPRWTEAYEMSTSCQLISLQDNQCLKDIFMNEQCKNPIWLQCWVVSLRIRSFAYGWILKIENEFRHWLLLLLIWCDKYLRIASFLARMTNDKCDQPSQLRYRRFIINDIYIDFSENFRVFLRWRNFLLILDFNKLECDTS